MNVFARRKTVVRNTTCAIAIGAMLYFVAACLDVTIPIPTPNPDDGNGNGLARLAVFDDPESDFSTSDVYDVDVAVI